ncbi:class B sortase [Ruminococcaceae bacterium OttesenSCG-928-L11]|nr:class B sortase [Ruminococcaceae bacterium OttesenSCG-928-L11]
MGKISNHNKILIPLLVLVLVLTTAFSGCASRTTTDGDDVNTDVEGGVIGPWKSTLQNKEYTKTEPPQLADQIMDMKAENADTVGWLVVPNTDINDVVVCDFTDNEYYLRKNFYGDYDFNGVFYADRRSKFEDGGSRDGIGNNTTIYGHAMTDNMENDAYEIKFGPLHNFRDETFAKNTPYIYFSTAGEDMVWEVFAVFFANRNKVAYNRNDLSQEEIYNMVKNDALPRSIYNYDVDVKADDKILTLSTCAYVLPNGTPTNYPKTHYRYVVMARLVEPGATLKEQASFKVNKNPIVDEDNYPN